jgi:nitric oxide reductase
LGVPFEDLDYLTTQNAIRTNGSSTALEAAAANQYVQTKLSHQDAYVHRLYRELLKYLDNLVDKRLADPKNDLVSKLVVEQLKPGHIEKSDAVQIAFLLLVAGNATMVNMIALVSFLIKANSINADVKSGCCRASQAP